jgi:hypothetical protein
MNQRRIEEKRMAENHTIYCFRFKIAGGAQQLPPPLTGAYVMAYATASSPLGAADKCVEALRGMDYAITDIDPSGEELPLALWDEHIAKRWPDFPGHFPNGAELIQVLADVNAVFGPFAGFETGGA